MKADKELDPFFYGIGWIFLILGTIYAVAHMGFGVDPLSKLPPCVFHAVTGYYCPGCGGSRAVAALFKGKLLRSLYYHPLVPYSAIVGGWFMLSQSVERLSRGKWKIGMHYRNIYLWIALALIILNCIVKNVILAVTGVALIR
jgi:hypothetical protein